MRVYAKAGVVVIAASLALTACSSSKKKTTGSNTPPKQQAAANLNDINPVPYDQVPAGGTLRWPMDQYPTNYNINEIDGNEQTNVQMFDSALPVVWHFDSGGKPVLNTDVVTKAEQTSTSPQTIQYHINDKAVWSDGTPITYNDFVQMWKAQNGTNKAFNIVSSTGYDQIQSVEKGATDYDVTVTFKKPFPDWQSLFSPITPSTLNDTPDHFNKGWASSMPLSGGPFMITKYDKTNKVITVEHNPKWWGRAPKLDKIQFVVLTQEQQPPALKSDQIDFVDIGSTVSTYAAVKSVPGMKIHKAGGPNWRHIDLGKTGPMADLRVRQAVMLSIDRVGDTKTMLGPLDWPATVLDSHIWMNNQAQYKSTCGDFCNRDITKADSLLEAAGYTKGADGFYAKGGKTLNLNFVIASGTKSQEDEAAIQQKAIQAAGIKVTIKPVPADPYFPDYIEVGKYDICIFSWIGTPFAISSAKSIYTSDGGQNYAKIGSKEIDDLYTQATSELDPQKAVDLSYQIDQAVWNIGISVPLYQRPDLVATKANLANFGSLGFADIDYTSLGFTK